MSSTSLSERFVALTRPHNTPGVMVHREETGGFVTLYAVPYWDMDNPPAEDANVEHPVTIRVTIGHNKNALICKTFSSTHVVCRDMWVSAGEEMYASVSTVNKLAMYGHSSRRPAPMLTN